jgi:hypothetical protein
MRILLWIIVNDGIGIPGFEYTKSFHAVRCLVRYRYICDELCPPHHLIRVMMSVTSTCGE